MCILETLVAVADAILEEHEEQKFYDEMGEKHLEDLANFEYDVWRNHEESKEKWWAEQQRLWDLQDSF